MAAWVYPFEPGAEDFTGRPERHDAIFDAVGKRKSAAALRHSPPKLTPGGIALSVDDGNTQAAVALNSQTLPLGASRQGRGPE